MLKSIYDGLIELCSLVFHTGTVICSHKELSSLNSKRNLVDCFESVLAKLSEANNCLNWFSLNGLYCSNIVVPPE